MSEILASPDGGIALLPPDLQARIQKELMPGERLIWSARPAYEKTYAATRRAPLIIGMILAIMGLVFLIACVVGHRVGLGIFFSLLFFGGAALPLYVAPALLRGRMAQTVYVLTDRKVLVSSPSKWVAAQYGPAHAAVMKARINRDGSGDLILAEAVRSHEHGTQISLSGLTGLDRVQEVESLIRRTLLPVAPLAAVPPPIPTRP